MIIDDEPLAREGIRLLIGDDPDVQIIGEVDNGQDAVEAIHRHNPDLIFLDVQMPEQDGFAVLRGLAAGQIPIVVFVTAFDRYAIDAFEAHALDYLLKPVEAERFSRTLTAIKSRFREREFSSVTERLLALMQNPPSLTGQEPRYLERIPVPFGGKLQIVPVASIEWIEADDDYVRLHVGKAAHLVRKTLTSLESELPPHVFVRSHRSYMVNVTRIKELKPLGQGEYIIVMTGGDEVKLSRTFKDRFSAILP
jgi:two-component system LytT family response regulator